MNTEAILNAEVEVAKCPDCGVEPGTPHHDGCDIEICTACKGQRMLCECAGHDPARAAWTGEWPGKSEAREHGWYTVWTKLGWVSCDEGVAGAVPDLNRQHAFALMGEDPGGVSLAAAVARVRNAVLTLYAHFNGGLRISDASEFLTLSAEAMRAGHSDKVAPLSASHIAIYMQMLNDKTDVFRPDLKIEDVMCDWPGGS